MTRTVKVTKAYGLHKSGTKEYHIIFVKSPVGGGLIFKRWNKHGAADGIGVKIELDKDTPFDAAIKERQSGGYDMERGRIEECELAELGRFLTPKMLKAVELRHLRWMFRDAEIDELPGASGNMVQERDEMRRQMEIAAEQEREIQRKAELARQASENAALENDPMWGMF